jgi:hypothetical protein
VAIVEIVVERALAWLATVQRGDGSFHDFELGPGSSGPWVTAHVALRLAPVDLAGGVIARARDYLLAQTPARWAYNERVPADADTISHALAFLDAVDELDVAAARTLLSYQLADGSFATFRANDADAASWRMGHPDVTPLAARALAAYRSLPGIDEALARAVARGKADRADGWRAFWWDLDWYTSAAWCAAARSLGDPIDLGPPPGAPPRSLLDAAHLLDVACHAGWDDLADQLAATLASSAGGDGRWPGTRALRVAAADCERPWEAPESVGGPLFTDVRGVYSTAAIASALAGYLSARSRRSRSEGAPHRTG